MGPNWDTHLFGKGPTTGKRDQNVRMGVRMRQNGKTEWEDRMGHSPILGSYPGSYLGQS